MNYEQKYKQGDILKINCGDGWTGTARVVRVETVQSYYRYHVEKVEGSIGDSFDSGSMVANKTTIIGREDVYEIY